MPQTIRLALPLLEAGQSQKEVSHNEAIIRLDALLGLAPASRRAAEPPAGANADTWIVAANAQGAWSGRDNDIAILTPGGWSFIPPPAGCVAFVRDEGAFIHYSDGQWTNQWPIGGLRVGGRSVLDGPITAIDVPTGGSVVDVEARAAIEGVISALRGHGLVG